MKIVTPSQMKYMNNYTIDKIGIPGVVLMENAARGVVEHAEDYLGNIKAKKIAVVSGTGNNGGDGFAAARLMYNKGADVYVFIAGAKERIKGDALTNLHILAKMGIPVEYISGEDEYDSIGKGICNSHLVIDALLGTGIKGEVKGIIADIIDMVNKHAEYVIAVDIPSGVDGETGRVCGTCIKADKTIAFGFAKVGHVIYPGKEYTGELEVVDISIPAWVSCKMNIKTNYLSREIVLPYIPERRKQSHKGDYGKVVVVGGTTGMTGAPVLSAQAALRSGAGLVTVGIAKGLHDILETKLTEVMTMPLKEDSKGKLAADSTGEIINLLNNAHVLVFGPGMGLYKENINILRNILEKIDIPIIIDADGLNALAEDIHMLQNVNSRVIITPHPGEMSRLTGLTVNEIQKDRLRIGADFSREYNLITVLKGPDTVIADMEGNIFINSTGNPGMATGGTGDVLAGAIAGFISQGAALLNAAAAGVFIHGLAGDMAAEEKGQHGLIAGDIVDMLPYALKKIRDE